MQSVDIVVNDVGVRILLPAPEYGALAQITRAAAIVYGIQREIERLLSFARQRRRLDGLRIKSEDRTVGGIDAAPRLAILILFVTHGYAQFDVSKIPANEFDQRAGIGAPIGIEQCLFLDQVPGKIQRRPGRSIRGRFMVFEELRKQRSIGGGASNLMMLDPVP